jgi:uncharacterized protein (TIGR03085 family)
MAREAGQHSGRHQSAHSTAARERAALCALLLQVGEHAPTLCSPWDTGDLAAHLLVRETRIDALPGLVIPALRSYTAKLEQQVRQTLPYAEIVEGVRSGPSLRTPLGIPGIRDRASLSEFFIHHEDVRRAEPGWKARELSPAESAELWGVVRTMAPLMLRGIRSTRVTLTTPAGGERALGRAESEHQVTLTGEPGELLLYLSGRRSVAEVKVSGDPAGQARLAAAKLGL